MRRLHHSLAVLGIAVAAFSSAMTWWVANLSSGQSVEVGGATSSALLWSVGAVGLAAYGLQFTIRRAARRVTGALQALSGGAFAGVVFAAAAEPLPSALEGVTSLTGIAGENALALVDSVTITGWHFSAVVAGILFAAAGLAGMWMPDRAIARDRFSRKVPSGSAEDSVSAWDSLSDGTDPTQR